MSSSRRTPWARTSRNREYQSIYQQVDIELILSRLMALLELAGTPEFSCENLVACLDRETDTKEDHDDLVRDLGWVGFEPTTLEPWSPGAVDITSDRWLFLSMEV